MTVANRYALRCIGILMLAAISTGTAYAAPLAHAGPPDHKHNHSAHADSSGAAYRSGHDEPAAIDVDIHFDARSRDIIRRYCGNRFDAGFCPPGLAKKKHNGCMPPGQAKKWRVGYPLPGDIIYYPLPDELKRRLGFDNPAYKLIRVGVDILRIAVGTGIVVDAAEDLGGLF